MNTLADDTDEDGVPDYRDPDSDNDTISDGDEAFSDEGSDEKVDTDGIPDYLDEDSDNDGILDVDEAGDSTWRTPPADSDDDGIPDFRELDSDDDGLSDADEVEKHNTDPTKIDTTVAAPRTSKK